MKFKFFKLVFFLGTRLCQTPYPTHIFKKNFSLSELYACYYVGSHRTPILYWINTTLCISSYQLIRWHRKQHYCKSWLCYSNNIKTWFSKDRPRIVTLVACGCTEGKMRGPLTCVSCVIINSCAFSVSYLEQLRSRRQELLCYIKLQLSSRHLLPTSKYTIE